MENSEQRKKKRSKLIKLLPLIIFLILIIYIILNIIKIPLSSEETSTQGKPYESNQISEEPRLTKTQQCYLKNFSWSWAWQGWANLENDYISPYFWIINFEDKSGSFDIQFAFFDNTEHPFDRFRGRGYNDFKDEISEDDVAMRSQVLTVTLNPGENRTITIPTRKPNPDHAYWALADVKEPEPYEVCTSETTEEELTKNQTVITHKETDKIKVVEESISLWDFLFRNI